MTDSSNPTALREKHMTTWIPPRPTTGSHDDVRNEDSGSNNPAPQPKWRRWSSDRWRGRVGLVLMQTATLLVFMAALLMDTEPSPPAIFSVLFPFLCFLVGLGYLLFYSGVGGFKRRPFDYVWPDTTWKLLAICMATPLIAGASAWAPLLAGVFILLIFQVIAVWVYGKATVQLHKVTQPALSPGSTNK